MNKKNLNNNKNEDNRRTIEINSTNEIMLDKLNKQIILTSNDNESYDNLFDCTNNNFIFLKIYKEKKIFHIFILIINIEIQLILLVLY